MLLRSTSTSKNTKKQYTQTKAKITPPAKMNNKLFSTAIYRHVIEHFDSIEIDKLDTFPAVNEYRNVHAWMLLPFHEYYDSVNKPPADSTHKIKLAVAKAKKLVDENDENMDDITQPEENITITKTMKIEALKEVTIDQA